MHLKWNRVVALACVAASGCQGLETLGSSAVPPGPAPLASQATPGAGLSRAPACTYAHVMVVAHRGAHLYAPANTVPALEYAFELGADAVEIDVTNTVDGFYVLMHDDTVDLHTNGTGSVEDMTLEEVKALEVSDTAYHHAYPGLQVPTLEEALEVVARYNGMVDMHMKTDKVEGAIRIVVNMGMEPNVFVYSSSYDLLMRSRSVSMDVAIQPRSSSEADTRAILEYFDPYPEHIEIDQDGFTPENVALIHNAGADVFMDALGVRDVLGLFKMEKAWKQMMDGGVDWIQTDFPGDLVEYRDSLCAEGVK